jgi:hypothetical protein
MLGLCLKLMRVHVGSDGMRRQRLGDLGPLELIRAAPMRFGALGAGRPSQSACGMIQSWPSASRPGAVGECRRHQPGRYRRRCE